MNDNLHPVFQNIINSFPTFQPPFSVEVEKNKAKEWKGKINTDCLCGRQKMQCDGECQELKAI